MPRGIRKVVPSDFDFENQEVSAVLETKEKPVIDEVMSDIACEDEEEKVFMFLPDDGGDYSIQHGEDGRQHKVIVVSINGDQTVVKVGESNQVSQSVADVLQARLDYAGGIRHKQFTKLGTAH